MRLVKRLVAVGAIALGVFGIVTLAALEGSEVVVVHTRDPSGTAHATRTWIADHDGVAWIEAANPDRPFYRDILAAPDIEIERGGVRRRYHAEPLANPDGHRLVRRLLAEKYGIADCWIGLLADTSRSFAIRLEPR
jgi:hypothetical protein